MGSYKIKEMIKWLSYFITRKILFGERNSYV